MLPELGRRARPWQDHAAAILARVAEASGGERIDEFPERREAQRVSAPAGGAGERAAAHQRILIAFYIVFERVGGFAGLLDGLLQGVDVLGVGIRV
jgi:hypothetical protein